MNKCSLLTYAVLYVFLCTTSLLHAQAWINQAFTYDVSDHPYGYKRHECGGTMLNINGTPVGLIIGGRGSNRKPIVFYPRDNYVDVPNVKAPFEIHHVQAATWRDSIAIIGMGFEGGYPNETPTEHILAYYFKSQTFVTLASIPASRQRGSAASIIDGDWLYYFSGLTDGHKGGWVNWVDRYNLVSGVWEQLADAPRSRDHAFALKDGNKVYLLGGRNSDADDNGLNAFMVDEVDVFDLSSLSWESSPMSLPISRAGLLVSSRKNASDELEIAVWGGESAAGTLSSGDLLNIKHSTNYTLPPLQVPTHATSLFKIPGTDSLYTVAGAYSGGSENEISSPNYIQRFYSSSIFPVEWLDLKAQNSPNGVSISWEVSELNVSHYQVQRRSENSLWEQIGSIDSKGDGEHMYRFNDQQRLRAAKLNYRIISVDVDGTINYSKTLEIQPGNKIFVYPNPLNYSSGKLKFSQSVELAELYDLNGRKVAESINSQELMLHKEILPGMYFLKLSEAGFLKYSQKILIK